MKKKKKKKVIKVSNREAIYASFEDKGIKIFKKPETTRLT